jgi:hypothetical protein
MRADDNSDSSRITRLETEQVTTSKELDGIWKTLRDIQGMLNKSQRTDWQTIFAGLVVLGALWAAAIHPINADVERAGAVASKLADAVVVQNNKIVELEIQSALINQKLQTKGTP